jgi:hypothetical protein
MVRVHLMSARSCERAAAVPENRSLAPGAARRRGWRVLVGSRKRVPVSCGWRGVVLCHRRQLPQRVRRRVPHGREMGVFLSVDGGEPVGHGERRRELERQFPGWEIWYVPREPDSATWCARPQMLIGADSPEDLAAAIRAAPSPVIPDSLLPASPRGYPARVRRLREVEESAGAARRRAKARQRRRVPRRRRAFRLAWPSASVSSPRHR